MELAAAGVAAESVGDFVGKRAAPSEAIPVLVRHLGMQYPPAVREAMIRAIGVPWARAMAFEMLCTSFRNDDRTCALGGIPAAQTLPVGLGLGLIFATELDRITWRPESRILVNGGVLPEPLLLARVEWSDECVWRSREPDFVLMNACEHGASLGKRLHFAVHLEPGEYVLQSRRYGWTDDDPNLILFRFVEPTYAKPRAAADVGGG